MSMPKEKILYVCDDKHNGQDAPLELKESVPYPENVHYGEKDSIHYYYQCPSCLKTYLAYQRMGKPLEWTTPDKEVWEKRITTVREGRVSILRKGLDEQKKEIEKVHRETIRQLKEITLKKEGLIKEIEKKNMLLEQLKKDEQELSKKNAKENEELAMIDQKTEALLIPKEAIAL